MMRQFAGTVNRTWLGVLGLALTLAGVAVMLVTTGVMSGPGSGPLVPSEAGSWLARPWVVVVVAVLGGVLVLLAVAWLTAQYPRTTTARTLRFHDDPTGGLTTCDPGAVCDAVEDDVETLAGVLDARVVLGGTASSPEATIRIVVDDRTHVPDLLHDIRTHVLSDLTCAMGAPLSHVGVRVDIDGGKRETRSITL